VVLANGAMFPHFGRMMGSEGDYVNAFAALGRRFGWSRINLMSGQPARWSHTVEYMTTVLQRLGFDAVRVGPASRTPTWEDALEVMYGMKRTASRVIAMFMYDDTVIRMVCAAIYVGMPKGIVWLLHGGGRSPSFKTSRQLDSSCTEEFATLHWEGAIGVTDYGRPAREAEQDRELDCFPNYTARTFHALLDQSQETGYPAGENESSNWNAVPANVWNSVIQGNAVDGTCVWAFAVRHMLSRNYTLRDLQRPSGPVFLEMVRYIREDLEFWGLIGRVKFNGSPNVKHTLSISQVQQGHRRLVEVYDQNVGEFVPVGQNKFYWGESNTAPTSFFAFCPEETQLTVNATCEPCQEGTYYEPLLQACVDCPLGYAKPTKGGVGMESCTPCLAGSFADRGGMAACVPCRNGTYAKATAQEKCEVCAPGKFGPAEGLVRCSACDIGSYQPLPGKASCEPCQDVLGGSVTPYFGASQPESCACPPGTYTFGKVCRACTEGLLCDEVGLGEPRQDGGYKLERVGGSAASRDVDVSAFKCRSEADCPAGEVGTCGPGHTGVACGTCGDGYFKGGGGTCRTCAGGAGLAATVTMCVLGAGLAVGAVVTALMRGSKLTSASNHQMTAGLIFGQVILALQTLGLYRQMAIEWPDPFGSVLGLLQVFAVDVEVLRLSCVSGATSMVVQFAFQLLGVPCVTVLLAVFTKLGGVIHGERSFDLVRFSNLVGLLLMACYTSIATAMMQPLYCTRHPNRKQSMVSNYSVLCWESSDHTALVAMSVIGTLAYPVSLLALVGMVTWYYPKLVASGHGASVLTLFHFLFKRFTPKCYFWGVVYLLRNLVIAATPVLVPDMALVQILVMSTVFVTDLMFEGGLFPWRTIVANVSNMICLACLLIFLQIGAVLLVVEDTSALGVFLCAFFVLLLATMVGFVAFSAYGAVVPGHRYDVFLCHHKDGAGSFARWLKIKIQSKRPKWVIFLDSDCLEELDLIVDIVATQTRKVAALLSRLLWTRPWCAAELTSAIQKNVPIIKIEFEDYERSDTCDALIAGWSEEQVHALARYGVTPPLIQAAYKKAFAQTFEENAVRFQRLESSTCALCMDEVLAEMDRKGGPAPPMAPVRSESATKMKMLGHMGTTSNIAWGTGGKTKVVVLGASEDAEARFTCEVIALLLQKRLEVGVGVATVHDTMDVAMHCDTVRYALVVFTRGLIHDSTFSDVLMHFATLRRNVPVEMLTVQADSTFSTPSSTDMENLDADLIRTLKQVFTIRTMPFSSLGSATLQDAQVYEISCRFSGLGDDVVLEPCALKAAGLARTAMRAPRRQVLI